MSSSPSAAKPEPALRTTDNFVRALDFFLRFAAENQEARALIDEARQDSSRRVALHIFFETADVALRDMAREERDVARGVATFSPHQPDRARILRVLNAHCARLFMMRRVRKLTLRASDCGFFAGFLAVLDALLLAPPGVEVEVDWRLRGDEQHFTYAPSRRGACVWRCLFAPVHLHPAEDAPPIAPDAEDELLVEARFNFFLTARFRSFFTRSVHYNLARRLYHDVYRRHVRLAHPTLRDAWDGLGAQLRSGGSLGIHKRVDTPGTAEYQGCKHVFRCADFIEAARQLIARATMPVTTIFLATDDAHAEAAFRAAFGSRLRLRDGVQRVAGGLNSDGTLNEVHIRSPHNPSCSIDDAVDVVADALLLASCDTVLHMDSNVTTAVAMMNPDAQMVHITDLLRVPQ